MLRTSRRSEEVAYPAAASSEADQTGRKTRSDYFHFAKHLAVMVTLMYAGMLVLDPLYEIAVGACGVSDPWSQLPVLSNLMMAVNMTIPMVLYMLHKRHSRRAIGEMSAAMFLPAVLTVGPYLAGAMTTGMMMTISHAAMIPLMTAAMILRFNEYAHPSHMRIPNAGDGPTP